MAALDLLSGAIPFVIGVDAVGGSVNQMESSDFTTMSLGEFRRLPFHFSAMTESEPSISVRVTRRVRCSHVTSRP